MKAEVQSGEERWIFEEGVQAANYYGFDERTVEIAITTPKGEVLIHLNPGEPKVGFTQADADKIRRRLRQLEQERAQ